MNRDKVITAREIYDFVHQGVTNASGGRQHPVMWGKFKKPARRQLHDFIFI